MRRRRSSERTTQDAAPASPAWDGLPAAAAAEPVIRAPRAAELAAPATAAAPARAA